MAFSLAISKGQRDKIKALQLPWAFYESLLSLLLLTRWRAELQPGITAWFNQKYGAEPQHVCSIGEQAGQLYDWFRQTWPRSTGRALTEVGLNTLEGILHQGYTREQLASHVAELKKRCFGLGGL